MKSIEWIDKVIEQENCSYGEVARRIGMTRQGISNHKTGLAKTLDDRAALKVANILQIKPEVVIFDQHQEREKDPTIKNLWSRLLGNVEAVVPALLALPAGGLLYISTATNCILCSIGIVHIAQNVQTYRNNQIPC